MWRITANTLTTRFGTRFGAKRALRGLSLPRASACIRHLRHERATLRNDWETQLVLQAVTLARAHLCCYPLPGGEVSKYCEHTSKHTCYVCLQSFHTSQLVSCAPTHSHPRGHHTPESPTPHTHTSSNQLPMQRSTSLSKNSAHRMSGSRLRMLGPAEAAASLHLLVPSQYMQQNAARVLLCGRAAFYFLAQSLTVSNCVAAPQTSSRPCICLRNNSASKPIYRKQCKYDTVLPIQTVFCYVKVTSARVSERSVAVIQCHQTKAPIVAVDCPQFPALVLYMLHSAALTIISSLKSASTDSTESKVSSHSKRFETLQRPTVDLRICSSTVLLFSYRNR